MAERFSASKEAIASKTATAGASGKPESSPLPILQQTAQQNSTGRKVVLNRLRMPALLPSQQTPTPGILARHGPLRAKQFLLVESSRNDPLPRKTQPSQDVLARHEEAEERARTGFAGNAAGTGLARTIKEATAEKARNPEAPKDRQAEMPRRRLEGALTPPDTRGDREDERHTIAWTEREGFLPPNTRKATAFSTGGEDGKEIDSASDFFPNTLEDDHSLDEESEADLLDGSECSEAEETEENYEEPGDQEEEDLPVSPLNEEELDTTLPTHTRASAATTTSTPKMSLQELQARQKTAQLCTPMLTERQQLGGRRTSPRTAAKAQPAPRVESCPPSGSQRGNKVVLPSEPTKSIGIRPSDTKIKLEAQASERTQSAPSPKEAQVNKEITAAILSSEHHNQSKKRAEIYAVAYTTHPYWKLQVPLITKDWYGPQGAYAMSNRQQSAFRSFKGPHAQYLAKAYAFSGGWVSSTVGIKSSEDLVLYHENFATYGGWATFERLIATSQLAPYQLKTKAKLPNNVVAPTETPMAEASPATHTSKKRTAPTQAEPSPLKKKAAAMATPTVQDPLELSPPPQTTVRTDSNNTHMPCMSACATAVELETAYESHLHPSDADTWMFDAGAPEQAIPRSLDLCSLKQYLESPRDLALKDTY
jgi:hypothetical protein